MKHFIRTWLTSLALGSGLVLAIVSFNPTPASAALDVFQKACSSGGSSSSVCTASQSDTVQNIVKNVINLLLLVLGMIAVIMIVIGGIRYTTSNGDQTAMTSAKNTILYSVIGLVVAILAFPIVNFVIGAFAGGGGTANTTGGGGTGSTIPPTQNPGSGITGFPGTNGGGAGGTGGGTGGNGGNGGTGGTTTPTTTYRNGTFTATGTIPPIGSGTLGVTLVIQNDIVVSTSASNGASGVSGTYTQQFINAYTQSVVGKPLASLNLNKVGGATLTTRAFNSAVATIRTQAHT